MTRKSRPWSSPWSVTETTLGCESRAAECASRTKRAREVVVVAEVGVHHLDRADAVQPQVVGLVDRGHPAAGDPAADR